MKSPKWMFAYAGFLVACGLAAFFMAPSTAHPATALYFTLAPAVLMVICGFMARMIHANRPAGMIGIHVGLVLPLILGVLYAWRAYKTFTGGVAEKQYLGVILAILAAGSFAAFITIALTRPKKAMRGS